MHWTPSDGHSRRGMPKNGWRDDLDLFKEKWIELALNRKEWKMLGQTFAHQ